MSAHEFSTTLEAQQDLIALIDGCSDLSREVAKVTVAQVAASVEGDGAVSGLLASVRERVDGSGLGSTPDGQAAIALATAMTLPVNQDGSKFASLYRQLTVALERLDALAPVRSSVDELRLRRDRKRAGA